VTLLTTERDASRFYLCCSILYHLYLNNYISCWSSYIQRYGRWSSVIYISQLHLPQRGQRLVVEVYSHKGLMFHGGGSWALFKGTSGEVNQIRREECQSMTECVTKLASIPHNLIGLSTCAFLSANSNVWRNYYTSNCPVLDVKDLILEAQIAMSKLVISPSIQSFCQRNSVGPLCPNAALLLPHPNASRPLKHRAHLELGTRIIPTLVGSGSSKWYLSYLWNTSDPGLDRILDLIKGAIARQPIRRIDALTEPHSECPAFDAIHVEIHIPSYINDTPAKLRKVEQRIKEGSEYV
jgi:hypothetical protein